MGGPLPGVPAGGKLEGLLEEKVAVLQVYWGEFPKDQVDEAPRAGVKVHQIRSLAEAVKAKEAGVRGIIIQGSEAEGHVIGQVTWYSQLVSSFCSDDVRCCHSRAAFGMCIML